MLGEEYMQKSQEYFSEPSAMSLSNMKNHEFTESISDRKCIPECEKIEAFILTLDNYAVQVHLSSITPALAFYGCSGAMAKKLYAITSVNKFSSIITEWENMPVPPKEEIIAELQNLANKLREQITVSEKEIVISLGKSGAMIMGKDTEKAEKLMLMLNSWEQ